LTVNSEHNNGVFPVKENKWGLLLLLVSPFLLSFGLSWLGFAPILTVPLFLLPAAIIYLFSFELSAVSFIISFFIDSHISGATPSEVLCFVLLLSFFFTHKFSLNELRNPLVFPLAVFFFSLTFSFINAQYYPLMSLRLLLFAGLIIFIPLTVKSYADIKKLLAIFVLITILSSMQNIYTALLSGKRIFGFSGVMFVDYVSISLVISFMALLYKKKNRFFYFGLTIILLAALIFTQTRIAWASCGATIFLIFVQFLRKSASLGFSRMKMMVLAACLVVVTATIFFVASSMNPGTFNRLSTAGISATESGGDVQMSEVGSLATRFFIWMTAWNAFKAHPIVGIGLYNFPVVSQQYSTLDPTLFNWFVEGLSPHVTFLAVITENGIVGLAGFIFFLVSIFIAISRLKKKAQTEEDMFYVNIIYWVQCYTLLAMCMSDAWLWGHGLMLWGLFLSLFIACQKIINKEATSKLHSTGLDSNLA
jgi:O-antigen ligase